MKSRTATPIRVPPAQSTAASLALASMVSGVAAARAGVSRVSRVANVNTSVRGLVASFRPRAAAPFEDAYMNCNSARA